MSLIVTDRMSSYKAGPQGITPPHYEALPLTLTLTPIAMPTAPQDTSSSAPPHIPGALATTFAAFDQWVSKIPRYAAQAGLLSTQIPIS